MFKSREIPAFLKTLILLAVFFSLASWVARAAYTEQWSMLKSPHGLAMAVCFVLSIVFLPLMKRLFDGWFVTWALLHTGVLISSVMFKYPHLPLW